jgi:hypothetical protein
MARRTALLDEQSFDRQLAAATLMKKPGWK